MTLEGEGQYRKVPYNKKGNRYYRNEIYIPSKVAEDSGFPFEAGENVKVIVDKTNKRLIIEKKSF